MSALSRNLAAIIVILILIATNAQAQSNFMKTEAANHVAEKRADSFQELIRVRQKAELRKYPTNKPLPLGEIRAYLEEVRIPANLEERWVLVQFLSLNGWDLFKNDGRETLFTGKGNENAILSAWIRNNKDLFKAGNISKKDLTIAK